MSTKQFTNRKTLLRPIGADGKQSISVREHKPHAGKALCLTITQDHVDFLQAFAGFSRCTKDR